MKKVFAAVLVLAVVAAILVPTVDAAAQDNASRRAQNKLLAYRAARVDGIRKLAERIKGLKISSETTVKDFVTQSDTIQTAMSAFLAGVREQGKPQWMEDGTCEVKVEITIEQVVAELQQLHKSYYKGSKFKSVDFEGIRKYTDRKVLVETGSGAPRPELEVDPAVPVAEGDNVSTLRFMSADAKKFWLSRCTPQGRLMAVRGARVDALRKLGERIRGLSITSQTTVKDFITESDDVNVSMQAFIRGAKEISVTYYSDELIVEVEMEVTLRQVYASLKTWAEAHYKGDKTKLRKLEELTVTAKTRKVRETGMSVPAERFLKATVTQGDKVVVQNMQKIASEDNMTPTWVSETMTVTGMGAMDTSNPNAAQAKLMAFRAAELDARRKLAERIQGLTITSKTSVKDFVATNDDIDTSMMTFQQGAYEVKGSRKVNEDGSVEVQVSIELRPLWNMIVYYQKKLSISIK